MRCRQVLAFALCGALAPAADVPFQLTVLDQGLAFAYGNYAVGDIDGDGKNDIVAGSNDPRITWRRHPDLATFSVAASANVGDELQVGDVDGDTDMDVVTSGAGITWYENPLPGGDPTGGPWTAHTVPSPGTGGNGSHDLKVGDIDGDGRLDAVERDKERPWTFYLQTSPGGWETFTVDAANNTEGSALGDLDGDGDLDISDGLAWFECPANPVHGTWVRHELGPNHSETRVAIADIDGDHRLDILVGPAEFGGTLTCWYKGPATPRTGTWLIDTFVVFDDPNFHTLQIGDIDCDGSNDIVLGVTGWEGNASWPAGWRRHVTVYYNAHGDASSWQEQTWYPERGAWQGVLGDVGSDGDLDLLTADFRDGGQGEFWENTLDPVRVLPTESRGRSCVSRAAALYDLAGRVSTGGVRGHLSRVLVLGNSRGRPGGLLVAQP